MEGPDGKGTSGDENGNNVQLYTANVWPHQKGEGGSRDYSKTKNYSSHKTITMWDKGDLEMVANGMVLISNLYRTGDNVAAP